MSQARHKRTDERLAHPSTTDIELLPMRALLRVLGLKSRQAVYDRLRKIDNFPKPRRVGNHSIAWIKSEVTAWVQSLPVAELDGFDAIEHRRSAT